MKKQKQKTIQKKDMFKIVLVGNKSCGKTSLIQKYAYNIYRNQYRMTVGPDFADKLIMFDKKEFTSRNIKVEDKDFENKQGKKKVYLQVWDTAGQDTYTKLCKIVFRGADCCVIIFDLTDIESFYNITYWIREFMDEGMPKKPEKFPFIIIGTKSDKVKERQVHKLKALQWCKNAGYEYYETSAKTGANLEKVFKEIAIAAMQYPNTEKYVQRQTMKLSSKNLSEYGDSKYDEQKDKDGGCC